MGTEIEIIEITEILKISGAALLAAVLSLIFREYKKEYSPLILAACGIIIILWGISYLHPVINYMHELSGAGSISEYFTVILKVLGISFIVQTGADICRDLGEASVASKIEFAGKAVILALVLPVLRSVVSMSLGLLS